MTLQKPKEPIQQVALLSQPESRGFHLGAKIQKRHTTPLATNNRCPKASMELFPQSHYRVSGEHRSQWRCLTSQNDMKGV